MGLTHVNVKLRAFGGANGGYTARFLVDTGASDCLAPASALRKIGVKPVGKKTYELANGKAVEYKFGLVEITVMGEVTAGRVIFGPEKAEPILGVVAMESAGIVVDPASQKLRKLPVISLK